MRQIVLDTETTGLEPQQGHRIIEIGCVELVNRKLTGNHFHKYINPQRDIDAGAQEVHGISAEFLADKPVFADIAKDFVEFVAGAELIIHNAPFDVGFIDHELRLLGMTPNAIETVCTVFDTLTFARQLHPGQRNNLDALCGRYGVNNAQRELHGALLDAEILADVFIAMTTGQTRLGFSGDDATGYGGDTAEPKRAVSKNRATIAVIAPDSDSLAAHHQWLTQVQSGAEENYWGEALPPEAKEE